MSENTSTSERLPKDAIEFLRNELNVADDKDLVDKVGIAIRTDRVIRYMDKYAKLKAQANDPEEAGREKSDLMRRVRWSGIDEQEPKERQYLYLACTELVGPREDKYVIEGYKDGNRYYAFVDGETGATEIGKYSIDYWMYKNAPQHPDT